MTAFRLSVLALALALGACADEQLYGMLEKKTEDCGVEMRRGHACPTFTMSNMLASHHQNNMVGL